MKALTLEDCKKVKITDLWLGLAIFEVFETKHNMLLDVYKTATEMGLDSEMAKNLTSIFCNAIQKKELHMIPMFLLKGDDGRYYSLIDDELELDPNDADRIDNLEPFSDYYSESEYRFVIVNGKVCIDVDSGEPFERYSQKALDNFALM